MKTILCKSMIPLLGICFLTLFSCKKDREVGKYIGEYEISGYVRDQISQKPVPYALVGVMALARGEFSYLGAKELATGRTDRNGKFSLKFYADSKENNYELTAQSLYYFNKSSGDRITFTKNGKRSQDVKLIPHSYLSLRAIGNKGGYELGVNGFNGPFKAGMDTTEVSVISPEIQLSFACWVYFSDTALNYKQIVELPTPAPHDTAYYTIEF